MEEFANLDKVKELFNGVNCVGEENCYFIAYKDVAKSTGMVNGMEYPYDALLINQTEKGIGAFYLRQPGFSLRIVLSKMEIIKDSYFFVSNEDIKELKVKNYALLNSKMKRIELKLNDGKNHKLYARIDEKGIPYQIENFTKFIEKNSNK